MKSWLVLPDGREIEVGSHCQIGRAPGAAVRIDSGQVSRQHAFIHLQDAGLEPEWWIADLGSTNGTIRNGRRVTIPCRLSDGDTIVVGDARLMFRQAAAPDLSLNTPQIAATVVVQSSRPCWLLMLDIKHFTTLMQETAPDALARTVGTWLRRTCDVIESADGVVDKFLGDALFAYWEADAATPARLVAVIAALQQMQAEHEPEFRLVLHFGRTMLAGGAGGANNVSGLEVIYVFRMEKIAARLGADAVASAAARAALDGQLAFASAGRHTLEGFPGDHELFSLKIDQS
jgi:adenylate cyclase